MATSSTYYIDTNDFATATAVWTDAGLTTKAPDGYYSFGGDYRQQDEGLLLAIAECPTVGSCTLYNAQCDIGTGSAFYTDCTTGLPASVELAEGQQDDFCAITGSVTTSGGVLVSIIGLCP
jgi:hypothetical protein